MTHRPSWLDRIAGATDRAVATVLHLARWLVLPVAALLLLQWPLREVVQRYTREANDLGQVFFALFVAVALTAASRAHAHLATDVLAHRYPQRVRDALARVATAFALVPWCVFVLASGAPALWNSLRALERFPETYNPGYFLVKAAASLLALLLLVHALLELVRPAGREPSR